MSHATQRAPFDFSAVRTCKIHPGIGIARVGNSLELNGYFIGPEVPNYRPSGGIQRWPGPCEATSRSLPHLRL